MPRFTYIRPQTLDETLHLLAQPQKRSRLLAGGTDLMIRLRYAAPDFDRIIDISRLPELKIIAREEDSIHIGASVTYTEILESALLQDLTPFFVAAARQIAGPQIRNQGSIGGNIVNAAGGADMLPPLVCLDATVQLASKQGQRSLLLTDFIEQPHRTRIRPEEVLTRIIFPAPQPETNAVFIKLGRQRTKAISRITIAAMGRTDARGRISFMRFVPGAIAPRVQRFTAVEERLLGELPLPELFRQAGEEAVRVMNALTGGRWSSDYKIPALRTLTQRALAAIFSLQSI